MENGNSSLKKSLSKIFQDSPSTQRDVQVPIRYISGPISWTGFEFGNKAIHLFGDEHFSREGNCESSNLKCSTYKQFIPDSDCVTIDGLIKNIFVTSEENDFRADVFLEAYYSSKNDKNKRSRLVQNTGYLDDIDNFYSALMETGETRNHSKLHYLDVRFMVDENQNHIIVDLFTILYAIIRNNLKTTPEIDMFIFVRDMLEMINDGKFDYYKSKNIVQFLKNLIKELEPKVSTDKYDLYGKFVNELKMNLENAKYKIKDNNPVSNYYGLVESLNKKNVTFRGKNISTYIQDFIEKDKNFTQQLDKRFDRYLNYDRDYLTKKDKESLSNYVTRSMNEILHIGSLFMDGVMLSKMFKRLQEKDSQIIIVYAGDAHIDNYIRFLTTEMNLAPMGSMKTTKLRRCLDNPEFSKIFGKWIDVSLLE